MRKFTYEARDKASSQVVSSMVQADSESAAAKVLIEQGLMPLSIKEIDEDGSVIAKLTGRITTKDKIIFLRQLSTLIGAGLPLTQSIHTVLDQTQNKQMQRVIEEIIADIEGGRTLSDAFGKHPQVFDKVVLALVAAGEASGTLDEALKRVATQKEKDAAMMGKIRGAMVYPAIVLAVIMGVMIFMLVAVVPQVAKLYDDMNKSLPFLTAVLIATANFIINYWFIVIAVVIAIIYFVLQYFKTDSGIQFKDTMKLNIPLFNGMFRKLYMARFTRTGETLLATGVAMLDMLRISSESTNNTIISKSINHAADKVKGGKALSVALQPEDYILPMVPQMIRIGEQSGKIDEMMGKTAQVYEDELDEEIKSISTAIEPVLMVVLAVFAGGMVGAILFPIYSLVGGIQ
ncbi:type II secretion system F family protein [Candidatus Saccharibacteria bacterium]|nr:type II secretion system F family protein [Candidatus Saccharibacteria bacterium]